jgi:rhodanese-related sulfurtransferase
MAMPSMTPSDLAHRIGMAEMPIIVDVRRRDAFEASERIIAGARWRDPDKAAEWGAALPAGRPIVVYCVKGKEIGDGACALLRALGRDAVVLAGGFEAFVAAKGPTLKKAALPKPWPNEPTRWVTRERPKIDRIACPWLITRFVDPNAEILYVAPDKVLAVAEAFGAVPFDIADVTFSHRGELCSFDTFLDLFGLEDRALRHIARIVRGADTARFDLEPQCAGLAAISFGLSASFVDDHKALAVGSAMYDALYVWARDVRDETHNWPARSAGKAA